ncbi:MAG: MBL fold metallo-hydrolase [Bdellovibrionales bacterium]|nr:MBL fold metallo-hydrolase [Bdellovibrionales bacterium]
MLIRNSHKFTDSFYLLTIGSTCHYIVGHNEFASIDFCASMQLPLYQRRLNAIGLRLQDIKSVFLTHLDFDRVGAIPYLKELSPDIRVYGSEAMLKLLEDKSYCQKIYEEDKSYLLSGSLPEMPEPMDFNRYQNNLRITNIVKKSDLLSISNVASLRMIDMPGHTSHSVAYFVNPHQFLIVDEGFGYFNGRDLCAPGGDYSLDLATQSVESTKDLDLRGIGLPSAGFVTGALIRKHLDGVISNTRDLLSECESAFIDGVEPEEIKAAVWESFYSTQDFDHIARRNRTKTFEMVWAQIHQKIQSAPQGDSANHFREQARK